MVNNPPKSMMPSPAIQVRPGWTGPPTNRQAPPTARPPQHPMQSYQPQGMMAPPPPHMPPPPVNMGAGGHIQVKN